ncbi:hypothetical protein [Erwinia sp. S38]|uniref:hypothetical protein n=1 Tax=Erwinia sp. S38 TaxID=2769338 RepID=UPI00190CFD44|nr:hypothetical protein [Erwinia sp. S38]MBK0000754.1 hypothetical protein [Erwinia sp. S38]
MNNHSDEKMTEHIIGEAVTELLNDNDPITWHSLLAKLHAIVGNELDEERVNAAVRAIKEIRSERLNSTGEKESSSADVPSRQQMH